MIGQSSQSQTMIQYKLHHMQNPEVPGFLRPRRGPVCVVHVKPCIRSSRYHLTVPTVSVSSISRQQLFFCRLYLPLCVQLIICVRRQQSLSQRIRSGRTPPSDPKGKTQGAIFVQREKGAIAQVIIDDERGLIKLQHYRSCQSSFKL